MINFYEINHEIVNISYKNVYNSLLSYIQFPMIYRITRLSNVLFGMYSQNKYERRINQPTLFLSIDNKRTNHLES